VLRAVGYTAKEPEIVLSHRKILPLEAPGAKTEAEILALSETGAYAASKENSPKNISRG
jgi:hypothetical protein